MGARVPAMRPASAAWPLPETPARPVMRPPRRARVDGVAGRGAGGRDGGEGEERRALRARRGSRAAAISAPTIRRASSWRSVSRVAPLADEAAVAEDEDAVGDRHHLAELVADEDDGEALRDGEAEGAEERLGLLRGEDGGGLVEDEDAGVAVEGLEDLDALALADGEVGDAGVGLDLEAEAAGEVGDAGAGVAVGRGARAGGCRG